jgi:hypothetical protein
VLIGVAQISHQFGVGLIAEGVATVVIPSGPTDEVLE